MTITRVGALRLAAPATWLELVDGALRAESGRVPEAAERLGVSKRVLQRWLAQTPELGRWHQASVSGSAGWRRAGLYCGGDRAQSPSPRGRMHRQAIPG